MAALLYMLHGTQTLFGVPPSASGATVALASRRGAAGVIELVGGALILLGLFTRPAAAPGVWTPRAADLDRRGLAR